MTTAPHPVDPAARADPSRVVTVQAPGRLHLGFLDPGGSLGRRFGSIGLVIAGFETRLRLTHAEHQQVSAPTSTAPALVERANALLRMLQQRTGLDAPLHLHLDALLPAHAGFGSGTQLALAVGHAYARWHGLQVPTATLAHWLGRGLRSGVGIGGFDHGGLLVDGGPGADGLPAPLLSQVPLPAAWRVVVVLDQQQQGLSGADEQHALATLPPMPRTIAADICHQVLMRVLPGAACADFAAFAAGVSHIQRQLGAHFAPAQGGEPYTSAAVGRLLRWMADTCHGGAAIGQSSWGPTGFAVLPTLAQAESLVDEARAAGQIPPNLSIHIVSARNHGATVAEH